MVKILYDSSMEQSLTSMSNIAKEFSSTRESVTSLSTGYAEIDAALEAAKQKTLALIDSIVEALNNNITMAVNAYQEHMTNEQNIIATSKFLNTNFGGTSVNYIIQAGDTLSDIARRYNVSLKDLIDANKDTISNPNLIYVGASLIIPGVAVSTEINSDSSNNSKKNAPTSKKIVTKKSNNSSSKNNGTTTSSTSPNNILGTGNIYVTIEDMKKMGWTNITQELVDDLNNTLEMYQINTPERIKHFISQCSYESGAGKWTEELASGAAYENRNDLGNSQPGDGMKYKGAGYIQLTGRYNYTNFANFIGDAEIVNQGHEYVAKNYPWESAGFWWNNNNMNQFVDNGVDVMAVTGKVNGNPYDHLSERQEYYNKASDIF